MFLLKEFCRTTMPWSYKKTELSTKCIDLDTRGNCTSYILSLLQEKYDTKDEPKMFNLCNKH